MHPTGSPPPDLPRDLSKAEMIDALSAQRQEIYYLRERLNSITHYLGAVDQAILDAAENPWWKTFLFHSVRLIPRFRFNESPIDPAFVPDVAPKLTKDVPPNE